MRPQIFPDDEDWGVAELTPAMSAGTFRSGSEAIKTELRTSMESHVKMAKKRKILTLASSTSEMTEVMSSGSVPSPPRASLPTKAGSDVEESSHP